MRSGSEDGTLILWDVDEAKEIRRFEGHIYGVWSVAFSPDGRTALSGAQVSGTDMLKGILRLWHTLSLDDLKEWTRENCYVREPTCDERRQYRIEPFCSEEQ